MHELYTRHLGALPTTIGKLTRLACARAQAAGIEPGPLLKKAGLTTQQIEDPGARLSVQRQINFLKLAASALQDEFLGFHLAQPPDLRELGLLYYVPASSEILGEALRRVTRYSSMANESLSLRYQEDKDLRITFNYVGVARHLDRHQVEFCLTVLIRLCRKLTGCRVEPSRVRFIHRCPGNFSEFAAFIGCDMEFGAAVDEVVFAAPVAQMPVISADPYLNELLIANCEETLSRRPTKQGPFRSIVENTIAPLLPHGNVQASEIARQLGLSQRTLARRLTSESLMFSDVLNSLRRDLATQYLADHALSISQIAWLLGYQEVSAFTNAFKRWTGKTPREARSRPLLS
ncbi:MAG TPA: AraC family transcriptional regulator [Xanthobacteraceae bacterium]|nr:AraC family transcriptional regulator [Xanthobacteraceae bacterium]